MLCSMTSLAGNRACFDFCVPKEQAGFGAGYTGLFLFRFHRYGETVEVVVDDFIPVNKYTKQLLFTQSKDEGEVWPCLLEKAYAKLEGSYAHLNGGLPSSSLVDFTGGFPERYCSSDARRVLAGIDKCKLWRALLGAFQQESGALVCSSTPAWVGQQGIIAGHAYTMTGARELQQLGRLVRLRNPWGRGEWTGTFSKQWILNSNLSSAMRNLLTTVSGEFWMPFGDFTKTFSMLSIVHLLDASWAEVREAGQWAGQWQYRRYQFTLSQDCEVMVSLDQQHRRQLRDEADSDDTMLPIRLTVEREKQQFRKLRTRTWRGELNRGSHDLGAAIMSGGETVLFSIRVAVRNAEVELRKY